MNNLDQILSDRGNRYGTFKRHAEISQSLKLMISSFLENRDKVLSDDQQEALEMICHKIARVINGDHNYADSWQDIAGYAQLVADRLNGSVR